MAKNKKILFTIPFVGGNKFSYSKFNQFLKNDIYIQHLELAGRGDRLSEELIYDMYNARDDLYRQIKDKLDSEYVIFGHSLGGILGYLLVLMIEEIGMPKPSKLIISAKANPQKKPSCIRHNLPKESFIESIKKIGGLPEEFFSYPELFEFFEPILRADFEIAENFRLQKIKKLESKISVLYGSDDSCDIEDILKWRDFSYQDVDFYRFDGNHFFIFNHAEEICNIIKQK